MKRVDLHVHSEYSKRATEWFLKKLGAQESYTRLEEVYRQAKAAGMDFVTVCDHNSIEGGLRLVREHPQDTFVSVEVTTYFPENGCKVHVLVFGLNSEQWEQINRIRDNIYHLRDYLKQENLAHSVAHATYSINRKLNRGILEKLILLFDVFEGINGARNRMNSEIWMQILTNLTSEKIDELRVKHKIEPFSNTPWIKGFTGGSDDHAGLFIGQTYAKASARTVGEFLQKVRDKKSTCGGRCSDYKSMVFSIYKIVCEYSMNKAQHPSGGFWMLLNKVLFENKALSFKEWLAMKRLKFRRRGQARAYQRFLEDFLQMASPNSGLTMDQKIDRTYYGLATLLDDFFKIIITSIGKNIKTGSTTKLIRNLSAGLSAMFVTVPFFSALKHLFMDRDMILQMKVDFVGPEPVSGRRILWFSDTINDLNGVTVTLRRFIQSAHENDLPVDLVVSTPQLTVPEGLPPNVINLPCIQSFTPDFYPAYTMHIPSLLKSIEIIHNAQPTEVIISTPGPVGLVGLVAAKLLGIKCTGIYHTDFSYQASLILDDDTIVGVIKSYLQWVYSFQDEIRVPSRRYFDVLEERGYDRSRMKILQRGFDLAPADKKNACVADLRESLKLADGVTLLWAGRVSKDKRVDFLADIYKRLAQGLVPFNLVIAGDGPYLRELEWQLASWERVKFTGRLAHDELMALYEMADLFVFPSTMDTFGMVVLEAQISGLPALVTDIGGPQELIRDGETGFVLPADDIEEWLKAIRLMTAMIYKNPGQYERMRQRARQLAYSRHTWDEALFDLLGINPSQLTKRSHVPEAKPSLPVTS